MEITRNPNDQRVALFMRRENFSQIKYDISDVATSPVFSSSQAASHIHFMLYNLPEYLYYVEIWGDRSMRFQIQMEELMHIANMADVDFVMGFADNPNTEYQPFSTFDTIWSVTAPAVDATGLVYDKLHRIYI